MNSESIVGYRLSPRQRHQWELRQAHPQTGHARALLRVRGHGDDAVRAAVDAVVGRHEVLSTAFQRLPGMPRALQVPGGACVTWLPPVDLSTESEEVRESKLGALFAEDAGDDVPAARIVRMAGDEAAVLLDVHGMAADAASLRNLAREVVAVLAGDALDDAIPFLSVSEWLNDVLGSEAAEAGRSFWMAQAEGADTALLVEGEPGAPVAAVRRLGAETEAALAAFAGRVGAAPGTVLLAAWKAVLHRMSRETRVRVAVEMDGRPDDELRAAVGPFAQHLPVSTAVDLAGSFRALVERLGEACDDAAAWQEAYDAVGLFDLLAPAADGEARVPCFRVGFSALLSPAAAFGGVSLERVRTATDPFALHLSASVREGEATLRLDATTLSAAQAERVVERLHTLLDDALARPETPVGELRLMSDGELAEALASGAIPADDAPLPVHRQIEARAARTPDAPAAVFGTETLTYAELNARANRRARRLAALGVGPEARVGVLMGAGLDRLEVVLAVLKAGGAYVPLDPAYPADRLRFMAADAGLRLVVASAAALHAAPRVDGVPVVCWENEAGIVAALPSEDLSVEADPASAAYVIYTSGSTGTPKGVVVAHGALARHAQGVRAHYGLGAGDRILQFASFNFDASVEQTLPPLASGACVVLREDGPMGTEALGELAARAGLTVLNLPTAQWHVLAAEWARGGQAAAPSTLRLVIAGGEAMLPQHVQAWRRTPAAGVRLLNAYGPTEAVVTASAFDVPAGFGGAGEMRVPIGAPLAGRSAYVLDERMRPVPVGMPGELYLGGERLARGYLGRPALTAERFVPDPFGAAPGGRLYRTGDVARLGDDGALVFLGRVDHQVKVRGFRIELGELEVALDAHPAVRQSAVTVEDQPGGEKQLVAYWVPEGDDLPSPAELRAHLQSRLPDYMVPGVYVALVSMPITLVGKVDRRALPAQLRIQVERPFVAPANEVEERVAALWAEVMGQERVSMDDNFFAVGGHSLLATRLTSRIRKEFGIELPVGRILDTASVAELAACVAAMAESGEAAAGEAIGRAAREGRRVRAAELAGMVDE